MFPNSKNFKKTIILMGLSVWLNACTLPQADTRPQLPETQSTPSPQIPKSTATKGTQYTATVIKVADGDTLTVRDTHGAQHKIRLAYIDAPEIKQNHGVISQTALSDLVLNQNVQIQVEDIDRYKREVAIVHVSEQDVNYRQIELGHAWHYTEYAKTQLAQDFQRYQAAMSAAKAQKSGLWQYPRPQAPWDYRKQQRQKTPSAQNHIE